jgi:hypothetical protein
MYGIALFNNGANCEVYIYMTDKLTSDEHL